MSDHNDDFLKKLAEASKEDARKEEVQRKKFEMEEIRTNSRYENLKETQRSLEILKKTDLVQMSEEQIKNLRQENAEYMEAAENAMMFLGPQFNEYVTLHRKNLITVLAPTGAGKSTAVANIIRTLMQQTNPLTGDIRRSLILTNEEHPADCVNRVTCNIMGWNYTRHSEFTAQQKEILDKYLHELLSRGFMSIVGKNHNGATDVTTTYEGITNTLNKLLADFRAGQKPVDVILIDYYQNIQFSTADETMPDWKVQAKFAAFIELFKNEYPACIITFAQVHAPDKDDKKDYRQRIVGSKALLTKSTVVIEMVTETQLKRTTFYIRKSRFGGSAGKFIKCGFDKGMYVEWNDGFIQNQLTKTADQNFKIDYARDIFKKPDIEVVAKPVTDDDKDKK